MANNAITNGQIKLGHVYHFRNKAYPKYALNVWSSSSYPQAKLSNVCLWEYDETDIAQKWVIKNSTPSYIQPLKGSSSNLYLDRYTGTGAGAGINAHLYTPSDTSLFDIQTASQDSVKIKVADKNLYLTAYGGTNGKRTGKTAKSEGNVFFAANSNSPTQEWIPVDNSSSGGGTYQKLIMPINQSVITVCYKENAPAYHEQGFSDPMHYAIDMTGTPRNFYASGDGTIVGYSATNSGPLGKWLAVRYDKVEGVDGKKYNGLVLRYCHLDDIYKTSGEVHINDEDAMARYGNTGTRFAHLHVEVDTDTVNYNKTPTIKGNSNGLVPAGNDDTTIDPFLVFHKKISEPENQSVSWSQSYCDKDNCSICAQYTQYEPGKVPYVNIEQCRNVPEIS